MLIDYFDNGNTESKNTAPIIKSKIQPIEIAGVSTTQFLPQHNLASSGSFHVLSNYIHSCAYLSWISSHSTV